MPQLLCYVPTRAVGCFPLVCRVGLRPVGQCSDHLIISSWEKNTWSNTISRTNTVAVYSWWLWFVMQGDDPGIGKRRKSNRFEKCLVRQHFLWFFCSGSWLLPKLVFPSAFSAHQILWLRKYPSIWLFEEKSSKFISTCRGSYEPACAWGKAGSIQGRQARFQL